MSLSIISLYMDIFSAEFSDYIWKRILSQLPTYILKISWLKTVIVYFLRLLWVVNLDRAQQRWLRSIVRGISGISYFLGPQRGQQSCLCLFLSDLTSSRRLPRAWSQQQCSKRADVQACWNSRSPGSKQNHSVAFYWWQQTMMPVLIHEVGKWTPSLE